MATDPPQMMAYWPIAAVLTSALGRLGGLVARLAGSRWDSRPGVKES